MGIERICFVCEEERIENANGFVLARDCNFLMRVLGYEPVLYSGYPYIREICGRCVENPLRVGEKLGEDWSRRVCEDHILYRMVIGEYDPEKPIHE